MTTPRTASPARLPRPLAWLAVGLLCACSATLPATPDLQPYTLGDLPNVHTFDGLFFAGKPSPLDLMSAADAGIVSVINLLPDGEQDFDEAALAAELGLDYHQVGWNGADQLTDAVFAEVDGLIATSPRPLLLHCSSANRVGAHWLVWRVRHDGLDWDLALEEARAIGLRTPAYEQRAREYLALDTGP